MQSLPCGEHKKALCKNYTSLLLNTRCKCVIVIVHYIINTVYNCDSLT